MQSRKSNSTTGKDLPAQRPRTTEGVARSEAGEQQPYSSAQLSMHLGQQATANDHAAQLRHAKASASEQAAGLLQRLQAQYGNRYVQRVVALHRQEDGRSNVSAPGRSTVTHAYPTPTSQILRQSSNQSVEDPKKPVFEEFKGVNLNKVGHVSSPTGQYEVAKTTGVNVRAKPDGALPAIAKVVYDTEVQVRALDNTNAFYFIVASSGAVGWINKDFVVLDPPDPGSRLHHITESNLTTILKNEYVDKKLWQLGTGNDYTTLAAAVVAANEGRRGVYVNWEGAKKYKEENTLKRWFDPWMIDNFAIYHGSTVLKGHNIWLPSPSYVRMLQSSGVIGSRPDWINAAVDVGKGVAGFLAGVVSGIFGSIWDTLTGLWELGKSIVSAVKGVIDGSLFASIEEIYDQIRKMSWQDLKNMVENIITMGKNAFEDFENKWNHPDTYQQWYFKGYIVGAIVLEVVLAIFTGGATLGAKVLAKIGKYFPRLMRILDKLLELADKLPGRRKDRVDGTDRRRSRDQDRDDNGDMSQTDRAWEQARALATIVTAEHDLQDTPVSKLIPMLNVTIASQFKGVSGYQAIQKGAPHTYRIIQMARNKDVDRHYTEKADESDSYQAPDTREGPLPGETGTQYERRVFKETPLARNSRSFRGWRAGSKGDFTTWWNQLPQHVKREFASDLKILDARSRHVMGQSTADFIDNSSNTQLRQLWGQRDEIRNSKLEKLEKLYRQQFDTAKSSREYSYLQRQIEALQEEVDEINAFSTGLVGKRRPDQIELFPKERRAIVTDITLKLGDKWHIFKTMYYRQILHEITGWDDVFAVEFRTSRQQLLIDDAFTLSD